MPLTHSGFFPIHDNEQIARVYELHQEVINGQLPPRLAPDLGFGYDYPLFNFYPSFAYYIAEIFHLLGFSYIVSTKLMIAFGFIGSAIAMYAFAREYYTKLGSVISAVLYTYASYHSIDVYVRGDLAEFSSFIFLPAIFWSFTRLAKKQSVFYTCLSAVLLCCFVLTHNLIALMSAPFMLVYLIYLVSGIKHKKRFIWLVGSAIVLGAGLSAFFWLPELGEKQYTMVNLLTTQLASYSIHFVYPIQFWFSPWGYGGSTAGMADGLSFQIGKVPIFLMTAAFIFGIYKFFTRQKGWKLIAVFISLFLFSLFMQTAYAKFIWDALPPLAYIQFPWRFLLLSAFTSSFIAASLFSIKIHRVIRIVFALIVLIFILRTSFTIFKPQVYLTRVTDQTYINPQVIRWQTSNESFEYTPEGIATHTSSRGNSVITINQSQIANQAYKVISGDMSVQVQRNIPQQKDLEVNAVSSGILQINVFAFPGWKIFTDGEHVGYSGNNSLRVIQIPLTSGRHSVQAIFTNTPIRTLANLVSLVTLLILLGSGVFAKRLHKVLSHE